jgi:hypothetical protein
MVDEFPLKKRSGQFASERWLSCGGGVMAGALEICRDSREIDLQKSLRP